jgi:hypothetical protein
MWVYSGWDSFLLNMVVKFFLKDEVSSVCLACPGREIFHARK